MKKKIFIGIVIILLIAVILGIIIMLNRDKEKENTKYYDKEVEKFTYTYGSYNGSYGNCQIYKRDEKVYISLQTHDDLNSKDINMGKEIDKSVLKEIKRIVKENEIYKWNGFNASDDDVLDGDGFNLEIEYEGGEKIKANGYMKYPENYEKGSKALIDYLITL